MLSICVKLSQPSSGLNCVPTLPRDPKYFLEKFSSRFEILQPALERAVFLQWP